MPQAFTSPLDNNAMNKTSNSYLTRGSLGNTMAFKSPLDVQASTNQEDATLGANTFFEPIIKPLQLVGNVLSTGQYATANVANYLIDVAQGRQPRSASILGAIWDGITWKEKGDFIDIMRKAKVPGAELIGFVLDIGLDPMTYVPFGALGKLSKIVGESKAVSAVKSVIQDWDIVDKTLLALNGKPSKIGESLIKKFSFYQGMPKEFVNEMYRMKQGFDQRLLELNKGWDDVVAKFEDKSFRNDLYKYAVGIWDVNSKPESVSDFFNKLSDVYQKAQDVGAVDAAKAAKRLAKGQPYLMPQIMLGHLQDWKVGSPLFKLGIEPNMNVTRTMKLTDKEFVPVMRQVSDGFAQLSKIDNIGDMKTTAATLAANVNTKSPVKNLLTKMVDELEKDTDGDIYKIRKALSIEAKNKLPIADMVDIAKLYENQLERHLFRTKLGQFLIDSAESQANGWVVPMTSLGKVDGLVFMDKKSLENLRNLRDISSELKQYKEIKKLAKANPGNADVALELAELKDFNRANTVFKELDKVLESNRRFQDLISVSPAFAQKLKKSTDFLGIALPTRAGIVPEEVMGYLDKVSELLESPAKSGPILNLLDKVVGPWRKQATILSLPYHLRNAMSNTSMLYMSGAEAHEIPGLLVKAREIQLGGDKIVKIGSMSQTANQWLSLLGGLGVRGKGLVSEVMRDEFTDEIIARATSKTPGAIKKAAKWVEAQGEKTGRAFEDNARIAAFISAFEKNGGDLNKAAENVWKHLIQFDQKTPWERSYASRWIPFYGWMRKNLPLQIANLWENPAKSSTVFKAINTLGELNPAIPGEEQFKPSYLNDTFNFALPEGIAKGFKKVFGDSYSDKIYISLDLPQTQLNDLGFKAMTDRILSSLSPVAVMGGLGIGYKMFPEPFTPEKKFQGERKPVPWPMTLLPQMTWKALNLAPIRDKKTGRMVLGAPITAVDAVMNAFPAVKQLVSLVPNANSYVEQSQAPWRLLSYFTGVKLTPSNKAEEAMYWAMAQQGKMQEAAKLIAQKQNGLSEDEWRMIMGKD
jgi:hypothetical protein